MSWWRRKYPIPKTESNILNYDHMILHCAVLPCVPASGCSALSSEGTCRAHCRSSSDASVPAPAAACTSRWSRPARPGHWGEPQGEENIKWIESLEEKRKENFPFILHFSSLMASLRHLTAYSCTLSSGYLWSTSCSAYCRGMTGQDLTRL